ncbi:hypothetical protein PHYSODRAFT_288478 [Phytophthora sojae]|uniref:RxLR effector protein n=1 Tax=Phytophthora sojae (strain P6497) TaxID=1094619 RepID=G5A4Y0_PHYSP|nr:hypothetical protein PHYSODRAFT_288478 [Phytophthora sojae]EGZ09729.1 hypothetical protein PHYSODRAFT_288478 [Phytophthora sojae]|eukprot:XP_009534590.1 hypothetical protein PHYSODRAFT_288478 [Phytophthora sojae]
MLRRVEKDEDDIDEERGFSMKELFAKFNPAKAKKHIAKIEKALKDAGDHDNWLRLQALKLKHGIN